MTSPSRHMSAPDASTNNLSHRHRQQSSGSLPPPSPRAGLVNLPVRSPQPSLSSGFYISSSPGISQSNVFGSILNGDCEEWMNSVPFSVADLFESDPGGIDAFVDISSDQTVEKACELMLERKTSCLAVYDRLGDEGARKYVGLFDYGDLTAFLHIAVNSHTIRPEDLTDKVRKIIEKGKEGGDATVGLTCDLSEKNPLVKLSTDASLVSLLKIFSKGTHRVLITDENGERVEGIVSDRQLVRWFSDHASENPSLNAILHTPLVDLTLLPAVSNPHPVISCTSDETILDAMSVMSKEAVSSVAVVDPTSGVLLSAVSVTDIGKIVAPSQDKKILATPLAQFIARIKGVDGSMDGEDRYPVFGVLPSNTLGYTMQKLLATNAHRVFITDNPSETGSGNPAGVVSMVDVLSVFARLANIPDVDPLSMSRHRRASSTASTSSSGGRASKRGSFVGVSAGLGLSGSFASAGSMNSSILVGSALSTSQNSTGNASQTYVASPVRSLSIGHRRDRSGSLSGSSLRAATEKK